MASPLTSDMEPLAVSFTSAWIAICGALMVILAGSILMLLPPTLSSIEVPASMVHLPAVILIV